MRARRRLRSEVVLRKVRVPVRLRMPLMRVLMWRVLLREMVVIRRRVGVEVLSREARCGLNCGLVGTVAASKPLGFVQCGAPSLTTQTATLNKYVQDSRARCSAA